MPAGRIRSEGALDAFLNPGRGAPEASGPPDLDPADSLAVLRQLQNEQARAIQKLGPDHRGRTTAIHAAAAIAKAIAALEKERAGQETPEQVESRKRREDHEVVRKILATVEAAEREAAAKGVCVKCGQPVKEGR